ncbi:hypothetical protein R3P38DRAFT_2873908 [Favolaschia claudopus]|uniref:F-box domain-containing protein n=1 Tax=Favolaschia claudopus TaxID=2862362 RepID=A0AAW0D5X9_9AGAR
MAMDTEGVDRLVSEMKPPLHKLRQLHDSSFLQEQGANPELGSRNLLPNPINCEEGEFSSRIPEELVLRIFRDALPPSWTAYFGRTRPPFPRAVWSSDLETKLTLIQVCNRWHRIGLEFLYESVSLKSIGQLSQLAVFSLALENSPHVGSLVQRLEICYWVPSMVGGLAGVDFGNGDGHFGFVW